MTKSKTPTTKPNGVLAKQALPYVKVKDLFRSHPMADGVYLPRKFTSHRRNFVIRGNRLYHRILTVAPKVDLNKLTGAQLRKLEVKDTQTLGDALLGVDRSREATAEQYSAYNKAEAVLRNRVWYKKLKLLKREVTGVDAKLRAARSSIARLNKTRTRLDKRVGELEQVVKGILPGY